MIDFSLLIIPPVATVLAVCIIYVYKLWLRMGKVLVEIIDNSGLKKKGWFKTEENKVVIEKGSKGRGKVSYKPGYDPDCWLYYKEGWFTKTLKRKLMLMEGAKHCISFKGKVPDFSRGDINELFEANVIKASGNVRQKLEVPIMLYLLVGAGVVMSGISLFILSKFA